MNIDTTVTVREESISKVLELMLEANPKVSAGIYMDKLARECGYNCHLDMVRAWENYYRGRDEEEEW